MAGPLAKLLQEAAWTVQESKRRPKEPAPPAGGARPDQPVQWVKTTSGTADGEGNYPCHLLITTGVTWEEQTGTTFVVRDSAATPAALADATHYACRLAGTNAAGVPLFKVVGTGAAPVGGAGGFQVRETAGGVVVASVTDLIVGTAIDSNNGGLRVVALGGGSPNTARIYMDPASDTDDGMVTISTQSFAGRKTFVATGGTVFNQFLVLYDSADLDYHCTIGTGNGGTMIQAATALGGSQLTLQPNAFEFDGGGGGAPTVSIRTGLAVYATGVTGAVAGLEFTSGWLTGGSFSGGGGGVLESQVFGR